MLCLSSKHCLSARVLACILAVGAEVRLCRNEAGATYISHLPLYAAIASTTSHLVCFHQMALTSTSLFRRLAPSRPRIHDPLQRRGWYPPALRWWNLVLTTLICWAFIAILQFYLYRSQTNGGVVFAPSINKLPLRQSFAFLYLPTIIAVIFSIFIVWIDNDAKRFEPYRQMSKPEGALAKDSVLLHYPFDFMPFVPFLAFKRR